MPVPLSRLKKEAKPWENPIAARAVDDRCSVEVAGKKLKATPAAIKTAKAIKQAWDERVDGQIALEISHNRSMRWV